MNATIAQVVAVLVAGMAVNASSPVFADVPPAATAAQEGTAGYSRAATAALSDVLAKSVQRGDAPAVVGLVVNRDGVLFEGAAGRQDPASSAPLPATAIFRIASMTKPVTSVAVMMLVEQGLLSVDDPVSKYLPEFEHPQVITKFNPKDGTYETRPARGVMTLRHLLTHTSGIGYAFTNPILAQLQAKTQKNDWELPLLSDPGAQWHYSASTQVLGMIVEKVTGQDLETWYQAHIFRPLGMVDTSFAVPQDRQSRLVTPLSRTAKGLGPVQGFLGAPAPTTPTPPLRGDGGLFSTAQDYGLFVRMLLNEGHLGDVRILSAKTVAEMGRNQIGPVMVTLQPDANREWTRKFPLGAGHDKFGLGFEIAADTPDARIYRRPGSLSWAGIYNTEFWVDPRSGIGAVLLMQVLPFYDEGALRTLREFEATAYRGLAPGKKTSDAGTAHGR